VKIIEIDSDKCIGCMSCVLACSLTNTEVFSYNNAVMKIVRDEPIELCQVYSCSNCVERKCIEACPFDAIRISAEYGIPLIDYDKCTSCGLCAKSCNYKIIRIRADDGKVYKCDFCGGSPACALSCIPNAIKVNDVCIKEVE
jgi:carbon-monoxide dehydrogenase iron sulfur subunit